MLLTSILYLYLYFLSTTSATSGLVRAALANHYSSTYSLGTSNKFDTRNGWETVNITGNFSDTRYLVNGAENQNKTGIKRRKTSSSRISRSLLKKPLGTIGNDTKIIEDAITKVMITWYTGKDLLNPSCWPKPVWTPTDQSLVCAVTLKGWSTRPACFEFVELCTSGRLCITVRVVDTCAGCEAGSKHIDLTPAAFSRLASLNQGTSSVEMRRTAEPKEWNIDLYGPK